MPKLGMEPKRRADVINATLTCISRFGIDGFSLDKVAEYAGCSKGVVTYYYKSKDDLIIEACKAFMAYFGLKIESELRMDMAAADMLGVVLKYILPMDTGVEHEQEHEQEQEQEINVSRLEGVSGMHIPYRDLSKLFLQFFSKAGSDVRFQEVISESYTADMGGIARIFAYGNKTGEMKVDDPSNAAYGFFAMVVGLSFFRVARVLPANGEDNQFVCQDYVKHLSVR